MMNCMQAFVEQDERRENPYPKSVHNFQGDWTFTSPSTRRKGEYPLVNMERGRTKSRGIKAQAVIAVQHIVFFVRFLLSAVSWQLSHILAIMSTSYHFLVIK